MLDKLFKKKALPAGKFSSMDEKVKAGITFTIKTYGTTLKDLASYDRGENYSR